MRFFCHGVYTQELLQLYDTCRVRGEEAVKNTPKN